MAAEQIETYWAIKGNPLVERSPQEFLSCSPSLGCNGGNTCGTLNWMTEVSFYSPYQKFSLTHS